MTAVVFLVITDVADKSNYGLLIPSMAIFPTALILASWLSSGPPWKASHRAVKRDRAWVASLPFALDGYFPSISREPVFFTSTVYFDVKWRTANEKGAAELVLGLVGLFDREATIISDTGEAVLIRSGEQYTGRPQIEWGSRTWGVAWAAVYVHRVVDRALLRVHRSHPIERVSVRLNYP